MADTIEGLMQEAQTYADSRSWDQAIESYSKVLELDADNDEACRNLAQIYALRGMLKSVISTYLRLMHIYMARSDMDNAMAVANYVLLLEPESVDVRSELINMYRYRGDTAEVVARSLDLARLYTELDEGDRSIELLQSVLNDEPNNADVCRELAEMYIQYGQVERGANQYHQVADLYQASGQLEKACEALERILVVNGNDSGAVFHLGELYSMLGRWEDAEKQFRNALKFDFENLDVMFALGDVCQRKGDLDQASLAYRKIVMTAPDFVSAQERLGEVYHLQNNIESAIKAYLTAAGLYAKSNDSEHAISLYQRVIFLDPNNPTATRELTNLGAPVVGNDGGIQPIVKTKAAKGARGGARRDKKEAEHKTRSGLVPKNSGNVRAGLVAKGGTTKPGLGGKPMLGGEEEEDAPRPGLMRAGLKPMGGGKTALGGKPTLGGKRVLGSRKKKAEAVPPAEAAPQESHELETEHLAQEPSELEPVAAMEVVEQSAAEPGEGNVALQQEHFDAPEALPHPEEVAHDGEYHDLTAPEYAAHLVNAEPTEQPEYYGEEYHEASAPAELYGATPGYTEPLAGNAPSQEAAYAGVDHQAYQDQGQFVDIDEHNETQAYVDPQAQTYAYDPSAHVEGVEGGTYPQTPIQAYDSQSQAYDEPHHEQLTEAENYQGVYPEYYEMRPLIMVPEGQLIVPTPILYLERTDLYEAICQAVTVAPDPTVIPWEPLKAVDEVAIEEKLAQQSAEAAQAEAEVAATTQAQTEEAQAQTDFQAVEGFDFNSGVNLKGVSETGLRRKHTKKESSGRSSKLMGSQALSERMARMYEEGSGSEEVTEHRTTGGIARRSQSKPHKKERGRSIMGGISRPLNQIIEEANQTNGLATATQETAPEVPRPEPTPSRSRSSLSERIKKARQSKAAAKAQSEEMAAVKAEQPVPSAEYTALSAEHTAIPANEAQVASPASYAQPTASQPNDYQADSEPVAAQPEADQLVGGYDYQADAEPVAAQPEADQLVGGYDYQADAEPVAAQPEAEQLVGGYDYHADAEPVAAQPEADQLIGGYDYHADSEPVAAQPEADQLVGGYDYQADAEPVEAQPAAVVSLAKVAAIEEPAAEVAEPEVAAIEESAAEVAEPEVAAIEEPAGDGLCSLSVESELPPEYLEEAQRLREKLVGADVTTAIGDYRRAIENSPENLVLRTDLADVHLRFSLMDDAINQYRQILRRKPDSVALRHRLACAHLWNEDFDEAVNVYFDLVELHTKNEQYADVIDVLQTILSLDPQNFKARRLLIDRFIAQDKIDLAIHHLRQFVDTALSLGSVDNAIFALKQLIELSDDPTFVERLAKVYEDHDNINEAVVYYRILSKRYTQEEKWAEALAICEKLVSLEPDNFDERRLLISLYQNLGRHDKAITEQFNLAGLYKEQDKVDEAAELYEAIVQKDPTYYEARRCLVDCYLAKGDLAAAMIQAEPLTERYESERLYAQAIEMYRRLVDTDPTSVALREKLLSFYTLDDQRDNMLSELLTLDEIHEAKGEYREAVRYLRRAIELAPERADLHCRLAKLYDEQLQSVSGAMQEYKKVFELNPGDAAAMSRYAQLLVNQRKPKEAASVLLKLQSIDKEVGKKAIDGICQSFLDKIAQDGADLATRFSYGELCYYLNRISDAIEQFQKTHVDRDLELRSRNMLGLSFIKMPRMREMAIRQFRLGLDTKGHAEQDYLELRYNLAMLFYQTDRLQEALTEFKSILAFDVTYRDVEARVKDLQAKIAAGGGASKGRGVPPRRK